MSLQLNKCETIRYFFIDFKDIQYLAFYDINSLCKHLKSTNGTLVRFIKSMIYIKHRNVSQAMFITFSQTSEMDET